MYGVMTRCIDIFRPKQRTPDDYANRIRLYIDIKRALPVGITVWDYEGRLVEDYGFEDLKLNVGLTDKDFSPDNPDYDF